MEQSPRLSLSYVMPSQAQKHVTVNETFRRLDALVQLTVSSRTITAEAGAPAEGDAYILPAGASGATWDDFTENNIAAFQDGAWVEIAAFEGLRAWVADDDELVVYDGAAWGVVSGAASETAEKFGVNATADATNRLFVKSNAILFDSIDAGESGSGDCRLFVNKEAAGDDNSVIFETGFSARASFGCAGDDDFHVKVTPDNFSTTYEALTLDKDNGYAAFGDITPRGPVCVRGSTAKYALQFSATDVDSGGYLTSVNPSNFFMSEGAAWEGSQWVAKATTAAIIGGSGANITGYGNTGLTAGVSFSVNQTLLVSPSELSPGQDNVQSGGSASKRYTELYAVSSTINTSDARDKDIAGSLSDAERRAARRILPKIVKYRWKDAMRRKGGGARIHFGVIAQDVEAAFAGEGLDAAEYGLWCADEIDGGVRYGIRYEELFAFLLAAMAGETA